jgi:Fe-S-cluster containining protein
MKFLKEVLKDKCLSCDICCRFPDKYSPLIPFFMRGEINDKKYFAHIGKAYGCRIDLTQTLHGYSCPYFVPETNSCREYSNRPLDCKLYPFMITYNKDYTKIILVLDKNCPYVEKLIPFQEEAIKYANNLIVELQDIAFINDPQPEVVELGELDKLNEFIFGHSGKLKKISLCDRNIFEHYNAQPDFINCYLWRDILNIVWKIEDNILKVYYGVNDCFNLLKRSTTSYNYGRKLLSELQGDKYKDKRNLCNYFQKNYNFTIEPLVAKVETVEECLRLYKVWAEKKTGKEAREYEIQLIEDSFFFHKRALLDYEGLGLQGITVKINDKIEGYTFGYAIDEKTFCILAEITDHKYKGINQFIFREFCRIIPEHYIYINAMDDSDIEGLRINKRSYHPISHR